MISFILRDSRFALLIDVPWGILLNWEQVDACNRTDEGVAESARQGFIECPLKRAALQTSLGRLSIA
jgi:hypothetical protein